MKDLAYKFLNCFILNSLYSYILLILIRYKIMKLFWIKLSYYIKLIDSLYQMIGLNPIP